MGASIDAFRSLKFRGRNVRIRYSHHARQRMQERKVSEVQVEEVLHQPDELTIGEQDEWIATRTMAVGVSKWCTAKSTI